MGGAVKLTKRHLEQVNHTPIHALDPNFKRRDFTENLRRADRHRLGNGITSEIESWRSSKPSFGCNGRMLLERGCVLVTHLTRFMFPARIMAFSTFSKSCICRSMICACSLLSRTL